MDLVFANPLELAAIVGVTVAVNTITQDGKTTWFEGVLLLAGYAPGREFTPVHERLASNLARTAGPVLARAGAYKLALDRPGDRWRRLRARSAGPAARTGRAP